MPCLVARIINYSGKLKKTNKEILYLFKQSRRGFQKFIICISLIKIRKGYKVDVWISLPSPFDIFDACLYDMVMCFFLKFNDK